MRAGLDKLDALAARGYALTPQDGWWVVGEKVLPPQEARPEGGHILELLGAPSQS